MVFEKIKDELEESKQKKEQNVIEDNDESSSTPDKSSTSHDSAIHRLFEHLETFSEKAISGISDLHIQTVIFDPSPDNQKNIEILVGIPAAQPHIKEAGNYKPGEPTNIPYTEGKGTNI